MEKEGGKKKEYRGGGERGVEMGGVRKDVL